MKKQYEAPKAEIVVFNYKESVAACHSGQWGWYMPCIPASTQAQQNNTVGVIQNNTHWVDTGSSHWVDGGTSYWKGN